MNEEQNNALEQAIDELERNRRIREAKVGDVVQFADGENYIRKERGWRKEKLPPRRDRAQEAYRIAVRLAGTRK